MVGAVAIKVDKELAFTQVADKTIEEGGVEFFIFSHPLLPDELAILRDKCPRGTKLITCSLVLAVREKLVAGLAMITSAPRITAPFGSSWA
jgi:hypothetical protein